MLTRLDVGQERNAVETIALNPLVRAAAQRLEKAAAQRGIRIVFDAGAPVHARVAPGPVDLVLANLLDNAVKFSPPDGVITVHVVREGEHALVGVADAGPGIGVEDLPHLFERFYRGAQARAGEAPGFGLGLALSQAIVHAYGGRIEARNRPQGGALFLMRLPASELRGATPSQRTCRTCGQAPARLTKRTSTARCTAWHSTVAISCTSCLASSQLRSICDGARPAPLSSASSRRTTWSACAAGQVTVRR